MALGVTAIFFYTQGLFIKPLAAQFGWSRAQASMMPTIFGLTFAVVGPLCGRAVDRFGVRPVTAVSILCLSAGFFALSMMTGDLYQFAAIILFIAVFGSATSAIPYVRLVGSWFDKARGLAIGVIMMGTGVTALFAPRLAGAYIAEHGWRSAYQVLAVVALLALPLVLVWGSERTGAKTQVQQRAAAGMSFREAVSTRRFWVLGITFALAGSAIAGLAPHFVPMLQDRGMSLPQAGIAFGWVGIAIVGGRLLTGFLCDHVFAPLIATATLAMAALGCLGLVYLGPAFAIPGALLIGLSMGAEIDLAGYMSARYFGLRSYGTIFGFQYGLFSLGAGVGPLLNGLLFDRFGNYDAALIAAAAILLLGIPFVLSLGRYPLAGESPPA